MFNGGFDELISDNHSGLLRNYWTKIFLLYNLMNSRNDIEWFVSLDADIVFCDFNLDIRQIINMSDKHKEFLVCCLDSSSEDNYWNINCGSMIIKNTNYMKSVIENILKIGHDLYFQTYEQVVLQNVLRKNMWNIREKTEIFPNRAFNHGDENTFLYHPCGQSTSNQNFSDAIDYKTEELNKVIDIIRKKNENTICRSL